MESYYGNPYTRKDSLYIETRSSVPSMPQPEVVDMWKEPRKDLDSDDLEPCQGHCGATYLILRVI